MALVLLAAGCGAEELTPEERVGVAEAHQAFARVVLDGSMYGEALDGVDRLIEIYRAKPKAEYDDRPMQQVLADAASQLAPYQPQMAGELDRAVRLNSP